ncbi:MAG: hypothetical protein KDE27_06400, partial [Planctomycetes bacterium]|nr:hypothetical protein [Planctomycetota bacterium]
WLIFVFGLYFGFRIQRAGAGVKSPGRTLLLSLIPVALLAGGFALLMSLELVVMPTKEVPGTVQGMPWFLGLLGLGAVVAIAIWPRLGLTLLVYALLARLPVVVVTWLALQNGWENTHYVAIAPEFTPPPADERLAWLIAPQLTAWPVATIVGGTVAGALGALLGRRRG